MSEVLLFNLKGKEKAAGIRIAAMLAGAAARDIPQERFGETLGALAGVPANGIPQTAAGTFSDEMLVMCGFTGRQLDIFTEKLRSSHCTVPLKAMLTQTNANWTPVKLHQEISAEHEAMKGLSASQAAKKSLHHKKK